MLYTLTEEEFKSYRLCKAAVEKLYKNLLTIHQTNPEKMTVQMKETMNTYREALGLNSREHPYNGV